MSSARRRASRADRHQVSAFVDTNVLVRHLTGDPPKMASRATAYLASADELLLTDLVVAETVYVLESVYEAPRDRVAHAVRSLLAFRSIVTVDPAVLLRAVEVYETARARLRRGLPGRRAPRAQESNRVASFDTVDRPGRAPSSASSRDLTRPIELVSDRSTSRAADRYQFGGSGVGGRSRQRVSRLAAEPVAPDGLEGAVVAVVLGAEGVAGPDGGSSSGGSSGSASRWRSTAADSTKPGARAPVSPASSGSTSASISARRPAAAADHRRGPRGGPPARPGARRRGGP